MDLVIETDVEPDFRIIGIDGKDLIFRNGPHMWFPIDISLTLDEVVFFVNGRMSAQYRIRCGGIKWNL